MPRKLLLHVLLSVEIWVYVFGRNQAKTLKVKVAHKLNDQVKIFPKQSYAN